MLIDDLHDAWAAGSDLPEERRPPLSGKLVNYRLPALVSVQLR
jgi:hypothetical protein